MAGRLAGAAALPRVGARHPRGAGAAIAPEQELREQIQALCRAVEERVDAVALAAPLGRRPHPPALPPNIYGAEGDWEMYATPSRDARLKASARELRERGGGARGHGAAALWHEEAARAGCRVRYRDSLGRPVELGARRRPRPAVPPLLRSRTTAPSCAGGRGPAPASSAAAPTTPTSSAGTTPRRGCATASTASTASRRRSATGRRRRRRRSIRGRCSTEGPARGGRGATRACGRRRSGPARGSATRARGGTARGPRRRRG